MTALLFLKQNWRWCLAGGVVVTLIAGLVGLALLDAAHLRERDDARAATAAERAAHLLTVANYKAAAALAAQGDAENVVRVVTEQQAITERVTHDFQDRLADSDTRYQRLRDQAASYSSGGQGAEVSTTREATCRAYANTGCDRLPGLLKAAQDNTDQLVALIAWAQAQAAVPVSDEAESGPTEP